MGSLTFTETLSCAPGSDRPRAAADNEFYGVMAPGTRQKHAKAAYAASSTCFPPFINLMSGCPHGEVRQGVSMDVAVEIEKRYGAPVPARLILT